MKNLEKRLKAKGYKITNQRRAILEVFTDTEKHLLTALEVFEAVGLKDSQMNFSTVYRNLEVLTDAGIIKRYNLDNGVNYYELDIHGHHHHLICLTCGEAKTIFHCPIEAIKSSIEEETDFTPVEHKLEIYGYCKECKMNTHREKEGGSD